MLEIPKYLNSRTIVGTNSISSLNQFIYSFETLTIIGFYEIDYIKAMTLMQTDGIYHLNNFMNNYFKQLAKSCIILKLIK